MYIVFLPLQFCLKLGSAILLDYIHISAVTACVHISLIY